MTLIKNLTKAFILAIIVGLIYMIYFYLIGVPRTQARYYYNQGIVALNNNDKATAKAYMEKALTYWREDYIVEKLKEI